jgi:ankyrin repeat protein
MRRVSQYNVNLVPRDWGVLHQMAMHNYSHRANLERLYDMAADINILSRRAKDTPLHVAAAYGSVEFINEMLLLRADHLKTNAAGKTPFDIANECGHSAAASLLSRC